MADELQTISQENAGTKPANTDEGNIKQTTSIIDRADLIRKGLEETEKRITEQVNRFEAAAARIMLAGRADAGVPQKTAEQLKKEEADKQAAEIIKRFKR